MSTLFIASIERTSRVSVYHLLQGSMIKPMCSKLVFARVRSGCYSSLAKREVPIQRVSERFSAVL